MEIGYITYIFQKFKNFIIPISKDLRKEFYDTIAIENFTRIIIMSLVFIVFELEMMITKNNNGIINMHNFIVSIIVITLHTVFVLIVFWLRVKKKRISSFKSQIIINLYCIVLTYWAVNISIGQLLSTGSITMLILTLTGVSAIIYRPSLLTLISNFGFYIYFIIRIKNIFSGSSLADLPTGSYQAYYISPIENSFNPIHASFSNYISDAFFTTITCCALGVLVYRLRLKVFLEQKAFEKMAVKDSMTNLVNHKTICQTLDMEIKKSESYSQPISIMMLDIDYFKKINDIYGHQMGDQVIIKLSKLLIKACRKTDYAGRYGGEEFLIVLTNTNKDEALKIGERIRAQIEKTDFGLPETVSVSGGIRTHENETSEEMIRLADRALYQAKGKGRNCISIV